MEIHCHTYYGVLTVYYPDGSVVSNIAQSLRAYKCPECGFKEVRGKEIYVNWYESKERARKAIKEAILENK